jgi:hypothetical protein
MGLSFRFCYSLWWLQSLFISVRFSGRNSHDPWRPNNKRVSHSNLICQTLAFHATMELLIKTPPSSTKLIVCLEGKQTWHHQNS